MQWQKMCEAVMAIAPAAWDRAPQGAAESIVPEVAVGVTDQVTVGATEKEKPPTTLRIVGGIREREKGFESGFSRVISRRYETAESDRKSPTEPSDASGRVATSLQGSDGTSSPSPLPSPSPDLFIAAGAVVAEWAARSREARTRVDEILRRAVDQATALREGSL